MEIRTLSSATSQAIAEVIESYVHEHGVLDSIKDEIKIFIEAGYKNKIGLIGYEDLTPTQRKIKTEELAIVKAIFIRCDGCGNTFEAISSDIKKCFECKLKEKGLEKLPKKERLR